MAMYLDKIGFFCLLIIFAACQNQSSEIVFKYPDTRKDLTIVDDYHGNEIADPYRWLENDHSDETKDWVKRQNKVSFDYLSNIPFRASFKDRLEELWNYEKYSAPFERAGKFYQFKNDGLQNQSVLYELDIYSKALTTVIDPNTFSDDGTSSLNGFSFDDSGQYLAVQISEGGSDWTTIKIKNLDDGEFLEDKIEWVKFSSAAWHKDGFYYSRYPKPQESGELSNANKFHKLYYHKLGTDQSEDQLIYEDNDHPNRNVYASTSRDERFLVMSLAESTSGNALKIIDLERAPNITINLVDSFDADYNFITNDGGICYFRTNDEASNWRIVSLDLNATSRTFKTVIPESENTISNVSRIGDFLFVNYIVDASSKVVKFDLKGNELDVLNLPGIGTVDGINGTKKGDIGFFSFSSFTNPTSVLKFDPQTLKSELYVEPNLDFPINEYETKQVWYTSKDGTKVPMFITHKKGLELNGENPTLLYGYGGFNISILPRFSVTRLPLLENGGIYAVANLRGGGEFGDAWHKAGTLERKQNVFDDFHAAAEYLIENKYTKSEKLAIEGRSNGGLLVGAAMTQRPDLYGVAFPHVGVLDMLRYHEFTIGWAWATDYGRSDDPEAFNYLKKYSPLHNIKELEYPATMVTTADHDDRVVPAHSFKFISELQDKAVGDNPLMIRIETSAGHGAGKPTAKQIEENADLLSFMFYNMDEGVIYMKQ